MGIPLRSLVSSYTGVIADDPTLASPVIPFSFHVLLNSINSAFDLPNHMRVPRVYSNEPVM